MDDATRNHIMTFNESLETIDGVIGAVTVLFRKSGPVTVVAPPHLDPLEVTSLVDGSGQFYLGDESDDEESTLRWL